MHDEEFSKALELSLIKHTRTIQSFNLTKPPNTTNFLSHTINLTNFEIKWRILW